MERRCHFNEDEKRVRVTIAFASAANDQPTDDSSQVHISVE